MIGDRCAQFAAAARVAVMQMFATEGPHPPAGEGAKTLYGALVNMSAAERQRALPGRLDDDHRLVCGYGACGNARGDEGPRADGRLRKPVGDQTFVCRDDGVAPKAGLLCQRPRRRQRLA